MYKQRVIEVRVYNDYRDYLKEQGYETLEEYLERDNKENKDGKQN